LRERDIKEPIAFIGMSKLVEVATSILDPLDLAVLLSLRLEKETSKERESLVVAVLNENLEEKLSVIYSKAET